jgi:hypothetical protein
MSTPSPSNPDSVLAFVLEGGVAELREESSSDAKISIMMSRCSKAAGLGALSAFWVARRRSRRFGEGLDMESESRAFVAMRR